MNLMTSSTDESTRSKITITGVTTAGGFAESDIGGKVYISKATVKRLRLQPGDKYMADLVPNHAQPDRTPWFAMYVQHPDVNLGNVQPSDLLDHLLHAGDAWTARQVAEVFLSREPTELDVAETHRMLDRLYLGNHGVAKVMMFRQSGPGGPSQTWFTAVPDQIDVGEFED
jgi:hypothetical protein